MPTGAGARIVLLAIPLALLDWTRGASEEVCTDARDNDGDGRVDCADSDCCAAPACLAAGCTPFKRGDVDGDGRRTITDAILILIALFGGGMPLSCSDAADLDDNDTVEIADPIYLLGYVFQGGPEPPPPFLECDKDPTQGSLDCNPGFRCARGAATNVIRRACRLIERLPAQLTRVLLCSQTATCA